MQNKQNKNFRKVMSIREGNKKKLLKFRSSLDEEPGIYILTRRDENEIKYAYIGQAKHILSRLVDHLSGYQHIDLSLKKHGFFDAEKNPYGWNLTFVNFPVEELDAMEQQYIKQYALDGYQLRNKTSGGQGEGKRNIDETRPARGYRDGLKQGQKNASREVAGYFEKYLDVVIKKPCRYADNALEKFRQFLELYKDGEANG